MCASCFGDGDGGASRAFGCLCRLNHADGLSGASSNDFHPSVLRFDRRGGGGSGVRTRGGAGGARQKKERGSGKKKITRKAW